MPLHGFSVSIVFGAQPAFYPVAHCWVTFPLMLLHSLGSFETFLAKLMNEGFCLRVDNQVIIIFGSGEENLGAGATLELWCIGVMPPVVLPESEGFPKIFLTDGTVVRGFPQMLNPQVIFELGQGAADFLAVSAREIL